MKKILLLILLITVYVINWELCAKDPPPLAAAPPSEPLNMNPELACFQFTESGMNKMASMFMDATLQQTGTLATNIKDLTKKIAEQPQYFDPTVEKCVETVDDYCCGQGKDHPGCKGYCNDFKAQTLACMQFCNPQMDSYKKFPQPLVWKLCPVSLPSKKDLESLTIDKLKNGDTIKESVRPIPVSFNIPNFNWDELEFGPSDVHIIPGKNKIRVCIPVKKLSVTADFSANVGKSEDRIMGVKRLSMSLEGNKQPAKLCFSTYREEGIWKVEEWNNDPKALPSEKRPFFNIPSENVKVRLMDPEGHDLLAEIKQMPCLKNKPRLQMATNRTSRTKTNIDADGYVETGSISTKEGVTYTPDFLKITKEDQDCIDVISANFASVPQAVAFYRQIKIMNTVFFEDPRFINTVLNNFIRPTLTDRINESLFKEQNDSQSSIRKLVDYVNKPIIYDTPVITIQDMLDGPRLRKGHTELTQQLAKLKKDDLPLPTYFEESQKYQTAMETLLDGLEKNQACTSEEAQENMAIWQDQLDTLNEKNSKLQMNTSSPPSVVKLLEQMKIKNNALANRINKIDENISERIKQVRAYQKAKNTSDTVMIENEIVQPVTRVLPNGARVRCTTSTGNQSNASCRNSNGEDVYVNMNMKSINETLALMHAANQLNVCFVPADSKEAAAFDKTKQPQEAVGYDITGNPLDVAKKDSKAEDDVPGVNINNPKSVALCSNADKAKVYCRFKSPPTISYDPSSFEEKVMIDDPKKKGKKKEIT
ncbi:MAG: hypothetical protein WCG27_09095, partial [Pseudomonadota bacterium]